MRHKNQIVNFRKNCCFFFKNIIKNSIKNPKVFSFAEKNPVESEFVEGIKEESRWKN
jgi:hypothetical protein